MPTTPASARRFFSGRIHVRTSTRETRFISLFSAALATVIMISAAAPAAAGPVLKRDIGSVATFKAGPAGGGPWTLGDKDWTYLDAKNWTGIEDIQLIVNSDPSILSHQFLIDDLSGYTKLMPMPLELAYKVHINGADGPAYFRDVFLGSIMSGQTVDVWKDVYASEADYVTNTNGWHLHSLNGVPDSAVFPTGLTDLWVRDTILLSGEGGQVSSINNTFRQKAVPEIDPASFGSVLAMVFGAFSLLERRARRALGMGAVA